MFERFDGCQESIRHQLEDLGLLTLRLFTGYEFLIAGVTKLQDLTPPEWFVNLVFPFPHTLVSAHMNWVAAGALEVIMGTTLVLGILSRLSSAALLYITYVAVYTVHFDLGWQGWNQIETEQGLGFKVPLMLGLMLWTVLTQGPGRFSLDHVYHTRSTHLPP